jgi:hypothetical protein
MYHTTNTPLEICLERNNKAITPLSHNRFLQVLGIIGVIDDVLQFFQQPVIHHSQFGT